jgi:hypothetical protein
MQESKQTNKRSNDTIQFNSVQFFIIYGLSQVSQGQLEAQHSVDKNNYRRLVSGKQWRRNILIQRRKQTHKVVVVVVVVIIIIIIIIIILLTQI